jgi:hypothetical protein
MYRLAVALGCLIVAVSAAASDEAPRNSGVKDVNDSGRVAAPVVYKDLMLVLASDEGVAAVVFTDELKEGRAYKFRYESNDGKTKDSGDGKVFEKYKRFPGKKPKETVVVDDGGELYLKAGPIKVEWSYSDDERGWIYYIPEKVRVQIATADEFDKVVLKRFAK